MYVAIACGAAWLFVFTAVTLNLPTLDAHGFHQTQTAISVYWMLHEHVFINYLTPVLTSPWSLPFEAPVCQVIVAAFQTLIGPSIDASGRLVSLAFFCGALRCCYQIIRQLLPRDRVTALLFVVAASMSPPCRVLGASVHDRVMRSLLRCRVAIVRDPGAPSASFGHFCFFRSRFAWCAP
jgi:hypothetical protein